MDNRALITIFIMIASGFGGIGHVTGQNVTYDSLRADLLSRPAVQGKVPPGGGSSNVTVDVSLIPVDILDVDDVKQVVSSSVYIILGWKDANLAWDQSSSGLNTVNLPADLLWKPHALVINGATTAERLLDNFIGGEALVEYDGTVRVLLSPVLEFTCKMDLRKYPFDTQECSVRFYLTSSPRILPNHVKFESISSNVMQDASSASAEWSFEGLRTENVYISETLKVNYIILEYVWTLKRKTTFFVISFIIPIVLTSYMNTLVFIIPAESGEKISYLVSIFVSNAVFISFCTDLMPQGLDETPFIMYLLMGIMAQSVALIVINSLILRRYHDDRSDTNTKVTAGKVTKVTPFVPIAPSTQVSGGRDENDWSKKRQDIIRVEEINGGYNGNNWASKRPMAVNALNPSSETNMKNGDCEEIEENGNGLRKSVLGGYRISWATKFAQFNVGKVERIMFTFSIVGNSIFVGVILFCIV